MEETVITEGAVIDSILATHTRVEDTTISVDTLLDEILKAQKRISTISRGIEATNAILEKYMIQESPEEQVSEGLIQSMRRLNVSSWRFLTAIKRSKYYSGFKTVAKDLEVQVRDFQELFQDLKLRQNPDQELLDLLNEAGKTYTG